MYSGDKVGSDEVSPKKPNRKEKLAFVVAEEGENIPARASIVISCGALVKVTFGVFLFSGLENG